MWPSSNQNRINLPIIIFRPVIILEFFYVRVFYIHVEDLYGVCAFDDRNYAFRDPAPDQEQILPRKISVYRYLVGKEVKNIKQG